MNSILSYLVDSNMNNLMMFRCRYSQALKPIFDKTAESLHNDHPVSNSVTCCYSDMYHHRVKWCWVGLTVRHPVSVSHVVLIIRGCQ